MLFTCWGFTEIGSASSPDDFPAARDCDRYTMAIPLHNRMTSEDYEFVVKTIKSLDGR